MMGQRKKLVNSAIFILGLWAPGIVGAITISESFDSSLRQGAGDLVWNTELGKLHPPLWVYHYVNTGPLQDQPISVGRGSHGAFVLGRYAEFSDGGDISGNVIRLNTDTYTSVEVTRFSLAAGWTLRPTGTKPLEIRSLGDIFVAGEIDCSGEAGADLNGDALTITAGGRGHCGGGAGGAGASSVLAAGDGLAGGDIVPNGSSPGVDGPTAGGHATATSAGGGGGGSYGSSRGAPYDGSAGAGGGGGVVGKFGTDNDFSYVGGGWGGGGGGYYDAGTVLTNSAGGGGGAGGGFVRLTAVGAISITGAVLARGGDGGSSNGVRLAGGGGGGGGGSIAMFAGGDLYLAGSAVVSAAPGAGGASPGGAGGDGSAGRTWLVGKSGYSVLVPPLVTPEYPDPLLMDVGVVRYQTGSFSIQTNSIDSGSTHPLLTAFNAVASLPGASGLTVSIASSTDGSFTPTTWLATGALPLDLDRHLAVQIILNNADAVSPATVDSLSLEIRGSVEEEFQFNGVCGHTRGEGPFHWLFFMLPFLLLIGIRKTSPA